MDNDQKNLADDTSKLIRNRQEIITLLDPIAKEENAICEILKETSDTIDNLMDVFMDEKRK